MKSTLEKALIFTSLNLKVFPLKHNTKDGQLLHSWLNEASSNEAQVREWLENTSNNFGVCTGDGLIVIDVDKKKSDLGINWLKMNYNNLPATLTVRTPSGGYHLYYHVVKSVSNRVSILPEVDIRGEHGYVVGPGSTIDDKEYKIESNKPIAEANGFIYNFLRNDRPVNYEMLSSSINEGSRNNTLFKLACSLQAKGISDEAILNTIKLENDNRCNPPLTEKDIETLVNSALRYDKGKLDITPTSSLDRYTTKDLLNEKIENNLTIVEDMIAVGVTLIAAPQKAGKTFFCIQLADAISSGTDFLGKKVVKGSVLYLAFEDHKNMIKQRLEKMNIKPKDNYVFDMLRATPNYDIEKRILEEIEHNKDLKLVVVDTFAKIRSGSDRDYETEYAEVTKFHELAFKYNLAIVLVTHVRKEFDMNNPFVSIYGSRGLTAGADSTLIMYQKTHTSRNRQLAIEGKDIKDDEMTIHQNDNCTFDVIETEIDDVLDDNLSRVINFVINNKNYEGSHDSLCAKLNLNLSGRGLQSLLKTNKDLLNTLFIVYEILPRTKKSRPMRLIYKGDESVD